MIFSDTTHKTNHLSCVNKQEGVNSDHRQHGGESG